ncbi:MAG: AAA-like domain-containing protein [Synechococcales bacterium]|nr:AAA-like domain-containing protein [Synechococcales bacterium]
MEFEQVITAINVILLQRINRSLSSLEIELLRGSWGNLTYEEIAEASGYSLNYLQRDIGPKFWRLLSDIYGQKLNKTNARAILTRQTGAIARANSQPSETPDGSGTLRITAAPAATLAAPAAVNLAQPLDEQLPATLLEIYVPRPPIETICYETLMQPGALVRIKAPALMGKTLLMEHTLARLVAQDLRTAFLSFELADRKVHFSDLDRFLRWVCVNLSRELGMPSLIDDYWDEAGMGSKVSCTQYMDDYLLAASDRPLVIGLDDVDLLFSYPEIYEDFFGLLRSWYEKARRRTNWKKLRLCIVHATDVYIQLNISQSPFNVGLPIELPEFDRSQALELAQQHQLPANLDLAPLIDLVGGHPYLLELAFVALKSRSGLTLGDLIQTAPTEVGIYASHLRENWLTVRSQADLLPALRQVMGAPHPVPLESVQAYQLQSMGLINLRGNQAEPRCRLYREYFNAQLNLPNVQA